MIVRYKDLGKIQSVSDLARRVPELTAGVGEMALFRGQNTDKPLKPKIARCCSLAASEIEAAERRMLDRFKKESVPLLQGIRPVSDWDWLSIAQHQGMSTRLLDWTANALAALWFAVSTDPPEGEQHGVVWILLVDRADLTSPGTTEIWELRRTYVFQPPHIDRRITAQSAWFAVHRYREDSGMFISLESSKNFKSKLKKLIVPRESFPSIREDLRKMGVTKVTLFPDLSGLAADIDEQFLRQQRNPQGI